MHRKVVTVLFCDVVGSTALDEAIAAYAQALGRYEQKENVVAAGRVERALEALRAGATA